ncbi:MAG TPA: LacI family DNA-binding transcriptional regulator [Anaerolineales bacterium]|nr:LacI family DNA-binding transcriptional regulator [Anaerolineales bacterium]
MIPMKRTTSRDVANLAHVSRTTVSFILNNVPGVSISAATRKRVLAAAKKLSYSPNIAGKKLVSGKSYTIGLVLCQSPEQIFTDAFLPQVILGVEHAAVQQGFHVLLKPVNPTDTGGYARLITENHVDGILLSGPRQDDIALMKLHRQHVPILLMGQLPDTDIPFVDVNATAGAELAVTHLIERGHRRIGIITNAPLDYTSAQQRRDGYLQALKKSKLPIKKALIKEGNYTPASGFEAMKALLQLTPRLTAVFVASDVVALGAMLAIKEAGLRIPKDMAVIGFDDIPLAEYYDPPLTTIRLPAFGLGWAGGERLIRLIQGEGFDREDVYLNSELIVRKSSFENFLPN